MAYRVTVLPENRQLTAESGDVLLALLRSAGLSPEVPCGGNGRCGKCKVRVDGVEVLACQTRVDRDMTVILPQKQGGPILTEGIPVELSPDSGTCLAIDIGTTTVVAYLMENGRVLSVESRKNPQAAYGADVVSRIGYEIKNKDGRLTQVIRACVEEMTRALLQTAGKHRIDRICVVGNPAMQQLFLGLGVENLASPPFRPVLTKAEVTDGGQYIPSWAGAKLLTVPDIAGYIGADTVACILAANMDKTEKLTLLVDIGTNGEMVLGNKDRMVACSTAAGPALEGAGISCGMRAMEGAVDHVWPGGCSVLGGGKAEGICGSGIVDAVAVALNAGLLNHRGRIENETRTIEVTEGVVLTQEDIRQVQQAKGAIAAGIRQMADHLGVAVADIDQVFLAGAFGSFLNPLNVCRIGLLPMELLPKLAQLGNAAGSGAKLLLQDAATLATAQHLADTVEHLELASSPGFQRCFADCMRFIPGVEYWCQRAKAMGFTEAVPLRVDTLQPRADVRAMCADDKCGAYGKNWTCPPHCGSLEECGERLGAYSRGILLQTVGTLEKAIDTKAYRRTEQQHLTQFHALVKAMSLSYSNALFLGSGGCRICASCAWPEPCWFPEKACSSMEAYGLFVTQVCRDNGLAYHHGEKTITYTACVLF